MLDVIIKLQQREILGSFSIVCIRQYIKENHPDYVAAERAEAFAQAVHDLFNRELECFDEVKGGLIKQAVLLRAVQNEHVSIRASHVFLNAVWLEDQQMGDDCVSITRWLQEQDMAVPEEELRDLVREIIRNDIRDSDDLSVFYERIFQPAPITALPTLDMGSNQAVPKQFMLGGKRLVSVFNRDRQSIVTKNGDALAAKLVKDAPLLQRHHSSNRITAKYREPVRTAMYILPLAVCLIILAISVNASENDTHIAAAVSVPQAIIPIASAGLRDGSTEHLLVISPNRGMKPGVLTSVIHADVPEENTEAETIQQQNVLPNYDYVNEEMQRWIASNNLSAELRYKEIDIDLLCDFLTARRSLLADEQYLLTILDIARQTDINPLLLIAITGQEQSFVPSDHANASLIANNPYNVFHSWQEYNTDIADATCIACRTIIRLGNNCPEGMEPLQWINRSYAQDPKWWRGVDRFLQELENSV